VDEMDIYTVGITGSSFGPKGKKRSELQFPRKVLLGTAVISHQ